MPTTIAAVLLLVFGVLPGVPGDKVYSMLVGRDWREDQWQRIARVLGFSLFGLAIYSILAGRFGFPPAGYLHTESLSAALGSPGTQTELFVALLGHFVFAGLGGILVGFAVRWLGRKTRLSVHSGAWDRFAYCCVPGRWVVVALKSGDCFAGILEAADTSVGPGERDLVLEEPAQLDPSLGNYVAMNYQHLYIPGEFVASIASVADPGRDRRRTSLGAAIFPKGEVRDQGSTPTEESSRPNRADH